MVKKSPLRKRRKRSKRQILYDKAWNVFSLWVRTRDKFTCFTCNVVGDRTNTNAGHFKHNVLDFDEINIHCQCLRCNHFKSGNLDVYAERLIHMYGLDEFNKLCLRAKMALRGERLDTFQLQSIINDYGQRIENLTRA